MSSCDPDNLDVETVIQKVEETNTCANLDPPVCVHIDEEKSAKASIMA